MIWERKQRGKKSNNYTREKNPWLQARFDCRLKVLTEFEWDLFVSDNKYAFYDKMLAAQRLNK